MSEAIIFNFSVKGRRLFEGGDYSRDGYYSRKYVFTMEFDFELPLILQEDITVIPTTKTGLSRAKIVIVFMDLA